MGTFQKKKTIGYGKQTNFTITGNKLKIQGFHKTNTACKNQVIIMSF